MNDEQYKRFRKLQTERIECLYKKRVGSAAHFLISGSSGTRYKVTIDLSNGSITCSCPDFEKSGAGSGVPHSGSVCKHCLCVIFNTLRLFTDVHHDFFKKCRFNQHEIAKIKDAMHPTSK